MKEGSSATKVQMAPISLKPPSISVYKSIVYLKFLIVLLAPSPLSGGVFEKITNEGADGWVRVTVVVFCKPHRGLT